jgi:tRNA(fMet)-specific endonuclease VapC
VHRGTPIGSLDTMIAAHALSQQATLVTNNTREFAQVPDLHVENWVPPIT